MDQPFDKGDFNMKQYLKNPWFVDRGEKNITFDVRFNAEVARCIKEEELFVHPRMKNEKDGGLIFEVTVNNEKEFLKWVLQYGASAEIPEPKGSGFAQEPRSHTQIGKYGLHLRMNCTCPFELDNTIDYNELRCLA